MTETIRKGKGKEGIDTEPSGTSVLISPLAILVHAASGNYNSTRIIWNIPDHAYVNGKQEVVVKAALISIFNIENRSN